MLATASSPSSDTEHLYTYVNFCYLGNYVNAGSQVIIEVVGKKDRHLNNQRTLSVSEFRHMQSHFNYVSLACIAAMIGVSLPEIIMIKSQKIKGRVYFVIDSAKNSKLFYM